MGKKFLLIFMTLLIALLAGCGSTEEVESDGTVLHLICWIDDMELDRLIEIFEDKHPDVIVEVKAYYDEDSDFSTATTRMNAELVGDNDADLYYLENAIDVMAMVNAGLLTDLKPIMEADDSFTETDYYENIWSAMELAGSLYELPAGFQIGAIAGPASLLGDRTGWTISEFQAFSAEQEDPEVLLPLDRESMLYYMTSYGMFDYLDMDAGSCSFDSDSFANWLEFVGSFPGTVDQSVSAERKLIGAWFGGVYSYLQYKEEFGGAMHFVGFPSDSATGPCIETLLSFGISSKTEQQKLCWEFLKTALSEEYQSEVIAYSSFPMMKSVLENQLSASMLPYTDENSLLYGYSTAEALTEEEVNYLRELVSGLTTIRLRYEDVVDIISEEASSYFSGDKSAAEVAEVIQNRVNIYLNEHS